MPGYKGHLTGGALFFGLLVALLPWFNPSFLTGIEWLLFTLAGSLFPDIDIKSKGQKLFYWVVLVVVFVAVLQHNVAILTLVSIAALVPMLVNHRGIFHRLWFVIALPASVAFALSLYIPAYAKTIFFDTFFFIVGAISHLWLDLGLKRMLRIK